MQPTPVSLPGESHGQRSLAGYSPWGCRVGQERSDLARTHRVYNCFWTFHKMQTCCCLKLCRFASKCDQFANLLLADSLILIFHAPRIPGSLSSPRLAVTSPILSAALHLQIEALLPPSLSLFQVSDTHGYQVFLIWSPLHRPHLVPALGPSPSDPSCSQTVSPVTPTQLPQVLSPAPEATGAELRTKVASEADFWSWPFVPIAKNAWSLQTS